MKKHYSEFYVNFVFKDIITFVKVENNNNQQLASNGI